MEKNNSEGIYFRNTKEITSNCTAEVDTNVVFFDILVFVHFYLWFY